MNTNNFLLPLLLSALLWIALLATSASASSVSAATSRRYHNVADLYNCSNTDSPGNYPPTLCKNQQSCCQAFGPNKQSVCIDNLETNYCCSYIGAVANCEVGMDCCGWGDDDAVSQAFCCEKGGVCSGSEYAMCCKPNQISCPMDNYGTCCDRATETCSANGGCEKLSSVTTTPPNPNGKVPGTLLWSLADSPSRAPISSNLVNVTLFDGTTKLFILPGSGAIYAIEAATGKTRFVTYVGGDLRNPPSSTNCASRIDELIVSDDSSSSLTSTGFFTSGFVFFIARNFDGNQTFGVLNFNAAQDDKILVFQTTLMDLIQSKRSFFPGPLSDASIPTFSYTGKSVPSAAGVLSRNRLFLQFCGNIFTPNNQYLNVCYLAAYSTLSFTLEYLVELPQQFGRAVLVDAESTLVVVSSDATKVYALSADTGSVVWTADLPKPSNSLTQYINSILDLRVKTASTPFNSPSQGKQIRQVFVTTTYCTAAIEFSTGFLVWNTSVAALGYNVADQGPIINSVDVLWEIQLLIFSVQLANAQQGTSATSSYIYYLYLPVGAPESNGNGRILPDDITPPCEQDSSYNPRVPANQQIISLGDIGDGDMQFPAFAVACLYQPISVSKNNNNRVGSYIYASTQIQVTSFERMWIAKYNNKTIVSNVYRRSSGSSTNILVIFVSQTLTNAQIIENLVGLNAETGSVEFSTMLQSRLNQQYSVGASYQLDFVTEDIVVASSSDKKLFGVLF